MSLAEVQQGQAQSLAPKKEEEVVAPKKKTSFLTGKSTGGSVPIEAKEKPVPINPPEETIPKWKFGPPKDTAIQPATEYEKYKKAVEEVRTAPAGTIISQTPVVSTPQFMGTNIWQATYQGAQEVFNPTVNKQTIDPSAEQRYKAWEKLPFDIKQQVKQGSAGTFENPFGLQTWRYFFAGKEGEKQAFLSIYDPYMQRLHEKFKSPITAGEFLAFETIPGAYYSFKGMSKGLGYVKGLGPTGASISHVANRAIGAYFTSETIKGASEATKQGPDVLGRYIISTGAMLGIGAFGMKGFKEGELLGTRKRFISNLESPEQIARAKTIFEAIDRSTTISSRNIEPLDLNRVENLRGNVYQQQALRNALKSREIKRYKTVLGGSAAGFESSPHDIDIYIKKSVTGKSNVEHIENIFKKYGVDISLYDIHDLPKKGESFPQVGTGFAERPIRTAPGSDFKYQVSLSEQAGRKFASAWSPLHELRGKDWNTAMQIAERKLKTTLFEELGKWKPQVEGDKFVGPSFYETHPSEVPGWRYTWVETQIAKHGRPVTSQDLFTQEAWKGFAKPEAEPYRPKFIEKPNKIIPDIRAKGVIFWSSGIPLSEGGSRYRFPIVLPIQHNGYTTSPESSYPKSVRSISSRYSPGIMYPVSPITRGSEHSPVISYPKSPIISYPKSPKMTYPSYPKYPGTSYPKSPEKYYSKSPAPQEPIVPSKPGNPYTPPEDIFSENILKHHKTKYMKSILTVKELNIPILKDLFGGR